MPSNLQQPARSPSGERSLSTTSHVVPIALPGFREDSPDIMEKVRPVDPLFHLAQELAQRDVVEREGQPSQDPETRALEAMTFLYARDH